MKRDRLHPLCGLIHRFSNLYERLILGVRKSQKIEVKPQGSQGRTRTVPSSSAGRYIRDYRSSKDQARGDYRFHVTMAAIDAESVHPHCAAVMTIDSVDK